MTLLTDAFVRVIVSSIRRARCIIYKKILNLLNEKVFLEHAVVELVYKLDEKSYRECLVSRSLKYDSVHKHIYVYIYIYLPMDTSPDHITPCSRMHMRSKYMERGLMALQSATEYFSGVNAHMILDGLS